MHDDSATILVVDDEPGVLALATRHLQSGGYTVLVAGSGEEALSVLNGRAGVVLALVDCNMPGISGPELDKMILVRWPHIKIVAMSGRPRSPDLPDAIKFLSKPFRRADLMVMVNSALNREAS